MKILLVDDDLVILELFSELIRFKRPEIQVLEASSAFEALEFISIHGESIKCILSDIKMPEMDGFELKRKLNSKGLRIPLVYVSAMVETPLKLIGKQLGAVGFLNKPLKSDDLLSAIDRAITYSQIIVSKPELLRPVAEALISQSNVEPFLKQLSEDYTIGRSSDSDIKLFSNHASREHAILNRTVESYSQIEPAFCYRIIDLSRNGFTVNGNKVNGYCLLRHGDLIELPDCEIRYFLLSDTFSDPKGTS
jgi:CheY-like chemotaxis protein